MKPVPAAYKRHVARLVKKLRWDFYANEYSFHTCYYDVVPDHERAAATIEITPVYLEATLNLSSQAEEMWRDKDYQKLWRLLPTSSRTSSLNRST